jgi:hypothetical protein
MQCPQCRADNDAGRRFCESCGAKLARLCRSCGHELKPQAKFCGQCGASPSAPAAPGVTPEPDTALQYDEGQNVRLTPVDRKLPMLDVATAATAHAQSQMVLMFTDIVDSVALKRRIGDAAYVALLEAHLALLQRAVVSESGARVVKSTGDGILARFSTPGDAVRAALRIQHAMAAGSPGDFRIRLGIHAGTGTELTGPNGQAHVVDTRDVFSVTKRFLQQAEQSQLPPIRGDLPRERIPTPERTVGVRDSGGEYIRVPVRLQSFSVR